MSNARLKQTAPERQHTLVGDIRTHKNFHSRFLPADRDIIVYLPPGYEREKRRRYPVLYLHDGQNLFDGATSFIPGQEWRMDETAQALIASGEIRALIIVGVYNTGTNRIDEYTPTKDAQVKQGGKADLYGRLLVEELKPFIDSQYRTLREAHETGLGGSSLGGLVSLYLGMKYPQVFGKLAVVSPSVWWDNKAILRDMQALSKRPRTRIWMDIGTRESRNPMDAVLDTRALRDALVAKGWKENGDLKYFEAEGAEHSERAWAERVGPMLKFLFGKKRG
ncbi:MAG TPA: alpha/beta hydrolase-fold protein [Pyrinomonadaceae bacterium]|nr:alpha/beta hydrolase-fold protein [Pyrinomonadaceae bacterium]